MSEGALEIQDFQMEDLEMLHAIDRVCFPPGIAFSRAELLTQLQHPQSITRVAARTGRILGFVSARMDAGAGAHIITLDVVPEARRMGIGRDLMSELHAVMKAKHIKIAVLEVGVSNLPARRLYEGMAYRYLELLSGYYNGLEDAYRMVRLVF
jgi:ribosomal-protein-alanine N-acetyltransferase